MNRITAVRRLQFCSGHRVHNHESKCRNIHGHNYTVFLHAESEDGLDSLGRVIDFGVLKQKFDPWIQSNWDHGMIMWERDEEVISAVSGVLGQKVFLLPNNPTAENMANFLLNTIATELLDGTGVVITKVVLWETENCFVEVCK